MKSIGFIFASCVLLVLALTGSRSVNDSRVPAREVLELPFPLPAGTKLASPVAPDNGAA